MSKADFFSKQKAIPLLIGNGLDGPSFIWQGISPREGDRWRGQNLSTADLLQGLKT